MPLRRFPSLRYLATLWLIGGAVLTLSTWLCFILGVKASTVSLVYLTIIVLLSLWDSFVSSALFSIAGVSLLNYFFIPPLFTFQVQYEDDIPMLGIFVLTSFVITGLVRRLQMSSATMKRQAQLLDLTDDTVIARDVGDVISFWNHGAERLYGWRQDEAVGQVSHALLKTRFAESRDAIDDVLRRTDRWEGELINTRKDGSQVTVASRWSRHRDARGNLAGTLETNNDITERKRAEEALRRNQAAYLAEAQKLSQTGSFGWNVASGTVFWSDQTFAILGYEPGTIPAMVLMLARVHADDAEMVRQAIDTSSRDRTGLDLEFRVSLPTGETRYVHAVARTLDDAADKAQFVGALMDVTAAKQSEFRLQEAQSQVAHVARVTSLGALSASIAHEVNQPLAAIVSHGEASLRWLNRDRPQLDEVAASIRHVITNGKRASEIVQRIRGLTSKTGGQQAVLNLKHLVEEVVPLVRSEATRNRAQLRLDLDDTLPMIRGDQIQLQQVIINLMINAIQAMGSVQGRPRVVQVTAQVAGDARVALEVRDSGPGIDPADAPQIFDAFFTTKPGGMGMGLSICRSIIESHGGQISAHARTPEPGTVFRCVLPTDGVAA